jgi:hypothetical protein
MTFTFDRADDRKSGSIFEKDHRPIKAEQRPALPKKGRATL